MSGGGASSLFRGYRKGNVCSLSSLVRNALPKGAEEHFRFTELRRSWAEVAGPVLAPLTAPVRIEDGCLVISATTQAVAHRTMLEGRRIRERLEKNFHIVIRGVRPYTGRIRPERTNPAEQTPKPFTIRADETLVRRYRETFRERIAERTVADALASLAATIAARRVRAKKK